MLFTITSPALEIRISYPKRIKNSSKRPPSNKVKNINMSWLWSMVKCRYTNYDHNIMLKRNSLDYSF